jgi:isocitrate/isopropylmalate dehydrogenase
MGAKNPMNILVRKGDGIGLEITAATIRVPDTVSKTLDLGLKFAMLPIGLSALKARSNSCHPRLFRRLG